MKHSCSSSLPVNGKTLQSVLLIVFILLSNNALALTLEQAEKLAIEFDPAIERFKSTSRSFDDTSIADNTLPDPMLRFGVANVPVDSFDLQQEQMTQVKLGFQQKFPRGDVLAIKQKQSKYLASASLAMANDARLKILSNVRETYLNLFYELSAYQIIRETRHLFSELVKITESNYAAGRVNQQDVVLADLELSRLDDRATKIQTREDSYRAVLAQWIGESAWGSIDAVLPELPPLSENIDVNKAIISHPLVRSASAKVDASKQTTEIARQDYKPGWSLLLDYGIRSGDNPDGSKRPDFATAMVSLDVPLFTANRQDKTVSAAEHKTLATRYIKDDTLRKLKQLYEKNKSQWLRLGEREQLYKNSLLIAASNNSDAAMKAYQSGVSEFNTLMRAQITELDVRLESLRIQVDRAIAQAKLLYVVGDFNGENSNEK